MASGWNKPAAGQQPQRNNARPSPVRGVVAGLVVVALAALAAYFLFSGKDAPKAERDDAKPARIKEVTPAPVKTDAVASVATNVPPKKLYRGHVIVAENVKTNGNIILTEFVAEDGTIMRRIGKKEDFIFETASDQLLAMAVQRRPGVVAPPMPPVGNVSEAEFLDSLKIPIIISKDDSEQTAELKRLVKQARLEMKEAIDAGEKFADVLRRFEQEHNSAAELTQSVRAEYRRMIESGDTEGAEIYLRRSNEVLEKSGAEPVRPTQGITREQLKEVRENEGIQ